MVGSVDRRGLLKCSICDAHGPCLTIQSIMKPVFDDIDGYVVLQVAQTPRSPDLAIFVLMMTDDRQN